ncbi:MAG: CPBP family intramembrane metalloprotease [Anaerolineae bacterium]|nr:CPBP family intramembrane metalloprotease [Anaerolineae bacterium]
MKQLEEGTVARSNKIEPEKLKTFVQATVAVVIFCALSFLGRFVYAAFGIAALLGLIFPLVWAKVTGNWNGIGFAQKNWPLAMGWGVLGGIATSLIGVVVISEVAPPSKMGLQLAIGVPMWLFMASPFQEFFFRGWLQPKFESALGAGWGLILTTLWFTAWHYTAPFWDVSRFPLKTPLGAAATFAAGLIYGYILQRTRSIVSPWLAHALSGIVFVVIGAMDMLQPAI